MIQVTKSGTAPSATTEQLEALAAQFALEDHVRLAAFVEAATLRFVQNEIRQGEFYERVHEDIGSNRELCLRDNRATSLLFFLMNQPSLHRIVEATTGCPPIGHFSGRIYRMVPNEGHHDAWHSDLAEDRLLAVSVNLSEAPYVGGTLELRDQQSGRVLHQVPNLGFGDAVVFRLAPQLQHRVTDMHGSAPKTAYAGWFRSRPTFMELLRSAKAKTPAG
jgi:hypothetical protein